MFKNMRKHLKNEKGLTLVELLAVIVILGIIGAIAVPSIGGIIQKANEDGVKAEAIQVINAAKLYVAAEGIENVPAEGLKPESDLAPYLDDYDEKSGIAEEKKNYIVKVKVDDSSGAVIYTITGGPIKAGNKKITFGTGTSGATITDINNAGKENEENKVITIPKAK